MKLAVIPLLNNATFIVVKGPPTTEVSQRLLADKFVIETSAVPELLEKASARNCVNAVVAGAKKIGAKVDFPIGKKI